MQANLLLAKSASLYRFALGKDRLTARELRMESRQSWRK
jgi:hypothetical protein